MQDQQYLSIRLFDVRAEASPPIPVRIPIGAMPSSAPDTEIIELLVDDNSDEHEDDSETGVTKVFKPPRF